jgi:AcrR family transcriptional regulator
MPGLRERKKEQTRADIVRVAIALFLASGFDNVTVDEIVAEVGVSHRTFYRYFAGKEDLVLGPVEPGLSNLVARLEQRPRTESVVSSVRAVVVELAGAYERDVDNDGDRATLVTATPSLQQRQAERYNAYENAMVPVIADRLDVDPDDDMRPALLAGCALASIRVATSRWILHGARGPLAPILDEALSMFTEAFAGVR